MAPSTHVQWLPARGVAGVAVGASTASMGLAYQRFVDWSANAVPSRGCPGIASSVPWTVVLVVVAVLSPAIVLWATGVGVERGRLRILGALTALLLAFGAIHFTYAGDMGVLVFPVLAPVGLAAVLLLDGFASLLRAEPTSLDHGARVARASALVLVACGAVIGRLAHPFAYVDLGLALLAATAALAADLRLREWYDARMREGTLVASAAPAPALLGRVHSPARIMGATPTSYRVDARDGLLVAVPLDGGVTRRTFARRVRSSAFVAVVAIGLCASTFLSIRSAHSPVTTSVRPGTPRTLAPSRWRGDITFTQTTSSGTVLVSRKDRFVLDIESAENGRLAGVIDWGDVSAEIHGTYEGDHLVFEDDRIRRTNGAAYELHDRKDVRVMGDRMTGTDKGGRSALQATRDR